MFRCRRGTPGDAASLRPPAEIGRLALATACAMTVAALGGPGANAQPQAGMRYELSQVSSADATAHVSFTLTNHVRAPVRVLKWYTPLEGFRGKILRIVCNGQELGYRGPMVKRGTPGPDAYMLLEPGASVQAILRLEDAYRLPPSGECTVEFIRTIEALQTSSTGNYLAPRRITVDGNTLTLRLSR